MTNMIPIMKQSTYFCKWLVITISHQPTHCTSLLPLAETLTIIDKARSLIQNISSILIYQWVIYSLNLKRIPRLSILRHNGCIFHSNSHVSFQNQFFLTPPIFNGFWSPPVDTPFLASLVARYTHPIPVRTVLLPHHLYGPTKVSPARKVAPGKVYPLLREIRCWVILIWLEVVALWAVAMKAAFRIKIKIISFSIVVVKWVWTEWWTPTVTRK